MHGFQGLRDSFVIPWNTGVQTKVQWRRVHRSLGSGDSFVIPWNAGIPFTVDRCDHYAIRLAKGPPRAKYESVGEHEMSRSHRPWYTQFQRRYRRRTVCSAWVETLRASQRQLCTKRQKADGSTVSPTNIKLNASRWSQRLWDVGKELTVPRTCP